MEGVLCAQAAPKYGRFRSPGIDGLTNGHTEKRGFRGDGATGDASLTWSGCRARRGDEAPSQQVLVSRAYGARTSWTLVSPPFTSTVNRTSASPTVTSTS